MSKPEDSTATASMTACLSFFLAFFLPLKGFSVCKAVGETRRERFGSGMCFVSAVGGEGRGEKGRDEREIKTNASLQATKRCCLYICLYAAIFI